MNNNSVLALATGENPTIKKRSDIDMHNLVQEWKLSASYVEQYTRDFPQLDTLVDAIPLVKEDDAPFVGDTTLAGLVSSIPRDSLQQLPVFAAVVNGTKFSINALLCTALLKKYIFNEDTFGKGLLSTLQLTAEEALKHGYAPILVAASEMYNDFGTTMRMLHYMDTSPEPGITDHNETGYDYVVSNLAPSRVRAMLRKAKANPKTEYDVEMLEYILEHPPQAKDYSQYQGQGDQNQAGESASPTYRFVTRYEVGKDGTQIMFCPDVLTERPVKVTDNDSKWGYPRVMYLTIDPAALTPFGKSRVRRASPNQNLMNIYYGSIASLLLINAAPPLFKRGLFTGPVQLRRNAVWESRDPNATVEMKNLDNGSLQFFPQFAQTFAGQIQNIMGGKTQSVNSGTKSGFGKTGPGEKRAQAFEDISTNQITKILENFLRQYALVGLDTLISQQIGEDMVIVDDETKNAINQIEPGFIGADNKIKVNWGQLYAEIEEWSIEILVSVSKDEMDEKKRADLQDTLVVLAQNADGNPDAQQKIQEITDMLVKDKAPLVQSTPTSSVTPQPVAQPQLAQPTGQTEIAQ